MALIDTSFHHIERQHTGYTSKAEAGVVSSIATDNSEDKSSYLKNDLVTLSNKKDEGSQNQHFSRNRYQAMAAYKAFSLWKILNHTGIYCQIPEVLPVNRIHVSHSNPPSWHT